MTTTPKLKITPEQIKLNTVKRDLCAGLDDEQKKHVDKIWNTFEEIITKLTLEQLLTKKQEVIQNALSKEYSGKSISGDQHLTRIIEMGLLNLYISIQQDKETAVTAQVTKTNANLLDGLSMNGDEHIEKILMRKNLTTNHPVTDLRNLFFEKTQKLNTPPFEYISGQDVQYLKNLAELLLEFGKQDAPEYVSKRTVAGLNDSAIRRKEQLKDEYGETNDRYKSLGERMKSQDLSNNQGMNLYNLGFYSAVCSLLLENAVIDNHKDRTIDKITDRR